MQNNRITKIGADELLKNLPTNIQEINLLGNSISKVGC